MLETYEKKCPFCGTLNSQIMHCNMFCNCGAKYYFQQGLWQMRGTKEVIIYDGKIKFDENSNVKKEEKVMEHSVSRGNVYMVQMPIQNNDTPHSVEQGYRPVVVVSSEVGCRTSGIVMVCPITTKLKKLSCNVDTSWTACGKPSQILCNQIMTMPKSQMVEYKGFVPKEEMRNVNIAMLVSLGIRVNYEEVN